MHLKYALVETAKSYTIAYKGLKQGRHTFDFEVDGALFRSFENADILDGACKVGVVLERGEAMLEADVTIDGSVVVACDRCLEDCPVPIRFEGRLWVKFADEPREYDGEVLWLMPVEDEIDLRQYIYESIVLSLPYRRVHAPGACDKEMLARFSIVSEREFASIEQAAEAGDRAQWAKLATLKERMQQDEEQQQE